MHFDGEPALVVNRYDRTVIDGTPVRIHQEDFCQALGVPPTNKYQSDDGGPSVEDMAKMLDTVGLTRPRDAIHQLLLGVGFNGLILGTDAHAKNYSLLRSGSQVRLAPFYDLASTAALGDHPSKLRMAQKVGGEYRPTIIGRRHWERLGDTTGVGGEQLCDDVVRMAQDLPDAFAAAVASEKLSGHQSIYASQLRHMEPRLPAIPRRFLSRRHQLTHRSCPALPQQRAVPLPGDSVGRHP